MDCHDARRLLEQGDAAPETERDAALEHLDRCAECAAMGPSLDPLLLFRRLPELEVSANETARMREAVAVLRRAPGGIAPTEPAPPRAGLALRLAAAIVAAGGLWLAPGPLDSTLPGEPAPAALADAVVLPEYLPSVETISDAYVATQITEHDLTLVILANVDVPGR
jgi:hypothetical protein